MDWDRRREMEWGDEVSSTASSTASHHTHPNNMHSHASMMGKYSSYYATSSIHHEQQGKLEVLEPEDRVYYEIEVLDVDVSGKKYLVRCLRNGESVQELGAGVLNGSSTGPQSEQGDNLEYVERKMLGEKEKEDEKEKEKHVRFEDKEEAAADDDVYDDGPVAVWVPRSCVSYRREPESQMDFEARRTYVSITTRKGGSDVNLDSKLNDLEIADSKDEQQQSSADMQVQVTNLETTSAYVMPLRKFVFEPQEGDAVEVQCKVEGANPVGYREGYMNAIIDGMHHITYPNGTDEMVEYSRIRPAGFRVPADFVKEYIEVPEHLRKDVLETEETLIELKNSIGVQSIKLCPSIPKPVSSLQCMNADNEADDHSWKTSSSKHVSFNLPNSSGTCKPVSSSSSKLYVEVVGGRRSMSNVHVALDIHFKRVGDFARLNGLQRILNARLESAKIQRQSASCLVFEVSSDVIGSCIGKNGCNLKAAQKIPGVLSIRVEDLDDRPAHRVEVLAQSEEAAEQARDLIEHVRVQIPVSREEIGPLIGRKGIHLREIEQRAGVSKFVLVEGDGELTKAQLSERNGQETEEELENAQDAPSEVDIDSASATGLSTASGCTANGKYNHHNVNLYNTPTPYFETVGPRKQIALAVQLFNMNRNYLSKQRELESKVKQLRESLSELGVKKNTTS
eukprot:CAMPEP_0184706788 /NCGR_PEP_ID=MMETSP0313-20130426/36934_1 /TAXON_ID=2792 /ORGANISM="Porphyridium aerugineum, Strain SAG 1380-2" /LENGTH=678 /DNA_ID=CAMNT_0027168353 /DNA_START=716 /DNA_END=2752 /DNA_ORIENTATION=+